MRLAEYRIEFAQSAARESRRLPSDLKRRVTEAVDALRSNPRRRGVTK